MTQTRATKTRATQTRRTRAQSGAKATTRSKRGVATRPPANRAHATRTRSKPANRPRQAPRTKTSSKAAVSRSATPFLILTGLVISFSLLGLTMVLSASSVTSLTETGSPWGQFRSQAMWLGVGVVACVAGALIDHRMLRRLTVPILVVSFALLVMVLLPWFGVTVNGAQRWIRLGPVQFQPSEIAKFALALFAADNLGRSKKFDNTRSLKPILFVLSIFGALILLQPNLGTTIVLFVIGIAALFASGVRSWVIAALGVCGATAAGLLAYLTPFRRDRLFAFLDPWADPLGDGWQTIQSLVSVANGGVTGVGIGESRGKFGFLPEAHNDFVFAVTAEEFGLVGAATVVFGYVLFGLVALVVARRADRFGALLVVGIASWIVAQAFINIGSVLGVMPITGVPLPFMSAGGTSLVVTLGAVGVMLNVARSAR